jgi:hypothetical protein
MRRTVTLALALGLAALFAIAIGDALQDPRDEPRAEPQPADAAPAPPSPEVETEPAPETPPWVEDQAGLADRLRSSGIEGTLYLSAESCAGGETRLLRAVLLPDLELARGPTVNGCPFTVSANGEHAAGRGAAWSPTVPVFAARSGPDRFEVVAASRTGALSLAGSAPAFKPDGTLTHALSGQVVEWSDECGKARESISPPFSLGREDVGPYCSRTAVSRRKLARALPEGDRLKSVDALAWLDSAHLVAVLRAGDASWLAAYRKGRRPGLANGLIGRSTTTPLADPTGRYVALTPNGYLEVYDRNRGRVWGSSSIPAVAFDWSPDGDWLAYAAEDRNVYFLRTSDWTTRFSLVATTEGLAWR